MSWVVLLEMGGALAAFTALALTRSVHLTRDIRLGLLTLLATVGVLHLLDALEWAGFGWADWLGDTGKVVVPVVWLVFLFAVSRAELVTDLQAAAAQLRHLIESAPVALAIVDAHGRCVHCNQQWLTLHRLEAAPLGVPLSESCGAWGGTCERLLRQVLATGMPLHGTEWFEPLGVTGEVEWSVRPWLALDGAGAIVAVVRLPTVETVHSDAKGNLRSRALEAIGAAASGVAHDINNLLTVISMHSETLHMLKDPDPTMQSSLDSIQQAIGTASSMTRELLSFSKLQALELQPVDLTSLVEANANLLHDALCGKGKLSLNTEPSVWTSGNTSAMQQILLNLVVNARDALTTDGTDGTVAIRVAVIANGARLEVEDSGAGIEPDVQARMFEPFFSTKRERGTGLGLAVVERLVRAQGGTIRVESAIGRGTTFVITFPRLLHTSASNEVLPFRADSAN